MISKTLKPCPFCGGTAMITPVDAGFVKYTVFCGDCGVTFGAYPTEEEAARVWNTRHELDTSWMRMTASMRQCRNFKRT